MAARPSSLPLWATVSSSTVRNINEVPVSLPNKELIPSELELSGVEFNEPVARQYMNQLLYLTGAYIQHLDERYSTGDSFTTTSAETATQISDRLGGTWAANGTLTDSLATVHNVFIKTA